MRLRNKRFIIMGLLALMMVSISIRAYAEFRYLDRVIVVKGFYRGHAGAVQGKIGNKYKVKLLPAGTIIVVSEDEIQWSTKARPW